MENCIQTSIRSLRISSHAVRTHQCTSHLSVTHQCNATRILGCIRGCILRLCSHLFGRNVRGTHSRRQESYEEATTEGLAAENREMQVSPKGSKLPRIDRLHQWNPDGSRKSQSSQGLAKTNKH